MNNTGWSKSLCAPDDYNTEYYLAQSDCLAADRQGQGDTRLTVTPSVITNSNYVIMVSDWKCLTLILLTWRIWWALNNASKWQMGFNSAFRGLKYFCVFFCTVIIRCAETFWSSCTNTKQYNWCTNVPRCNIYAYIVCLVYSCTQHTRHVWQTNAAAVPAAILSSWRHYSNH
jgi:hypothetical protein